MAKTKSYPIQIEITEKQAKALVEATPTGLPEAQTIAGIAQTAVADLADGGMLVDPGTARQIIALTGPLTDMQDLVKCIEQAHSMEDGAVSIKWKVDPTFIPYYQSIADSTGQTLESYLQNIMNYAQFQGWIGSVVPESEVLFMSTADKKRVGRAIGKDNPTGTDIAEWIDRMVGDPDLDSLTIGPVTAHLK